MKAFGERAVVGTAALAPLAYFALTPTLVYPFVTGPTAIFRAFAALTVLMLAVCGGGIRLSWLSVSLAGLVSVNVLATIFADNPALAMWGNLERMDGLVNIVCLVALTAAISSTATTDKRRSFILGMFCIVATIIGLVAAAQIVGMHPFVKKWRPDSFLGNSDYLGVFCLFALFCSCAGITIAPRFKPLWIVSAIVAMLSVVMSGCRGAILGLVVGSVVASLMSKSRMVRLAMLSLVAFTVASLGVLMLPGVALHAQFMSVDSVTSRISLWLGILPELLHHPVLGTGPGSLPYVLERVPVAGLGDSPWFDRAHSWIIDQFVNAGAIGLFAYVSVFVAAFVVAKRSSNSAAWGGCIAAYLTCNAFGFDTIATYIPLAVVLGLIGSEAPEIEAISVPARHTLAGAIAASVLALMPSTYSAIMSAADVHDALVATDPEQVQFLFGRAISRGYPGRSDAVVLMADRALNTKDRGLGLKAISAERDEIGLYGAHARNLVMLMALNQQGGG